MTFQSLQRPAVSQKNCILSKMCKEERYRHRPCHSSKGRRTSRLTVQILTKSMAMPRSFGLAVSTANLSPQANPFTHCLDGEFTEVQRNIVRQIYAFRSKANPKCVDLRIYRKHCYFARHSSKLEQNKSSRHSLMTTLQLFSNIPRSDSGNRKSTTHRGCFRRLSNQEEERSML